MEQKLTISEITYIRNLAEHKTDEELAKMIGKPLTLVQMQLSLISDLPKRPWEKRPWEQGIVPEVPATPVVDAEQLVKPKMKPVTLKPLKIGRKKKKTPAKKKAPFKKKAVSKKQKPVKEKVEKKLISAHAQAMDRLKARKVNPRNSIYKTKPLDLSGKIRVKLNAKTEVWVAPGTDIEKLKRKLNIA